MSKVWKVKTRSNAHAVTPARWFRDTVLHLSHVSCQQLHVWVSGLVLSDCFSLLCYYVIVRILRNIKTATPVSQSDNQGILVPESTEYGNFPQ